MLTSLPKQMSTLHIRLHLSYARCCFAKCIQVVNIMQIHPNDARSHRYCYHSSVFIEMGTFLLLCCGHATECFYYLWACMLFLRCPASIRSGYIISCELPNNTNKSWWAPPTFLTLSMLPFININSKCSIFSTPYINLGKKQWLVIVF